MTKKLKKNLTGSEIRKAVGKKNLTLLFHEEKIKYLFNTLNHIERGCVQDFEYKAIEDLVEIVRADLDLVSTIGYQGQENNYMKTLKHSPDEYVGKHES